MLITIILIRVKLIFLVNLITQEHEMLETSCFHLRYSMRSRLSDYTSEHYLHINEFFSRNEGVERNSSTSGFLTSFSHPVAFVHVERTDAGLLFFTPEELLFHFMSEGLFPVKWGG